MFSFPVWQTEFWSIGFSYSKMSELDNQTTKQTLFFSWVKVTSYNLTLFTISPLLYICFGISASPARLIKIVEPSAEGNYTDKPLMGMQASC